MTSRIGTKLDIYGPATCPICGNSKESIWAGERYQLTCRRHPGHPLHQPAPAGGQTPSPGRASKVGS